MLKQIILYSFIIFLASCSVDEEPTTGTYSILEYRQNTPPIANETLNFADAVCIIHNGNEVCASGSLSFSSVGTYQSDIRVRGVDQSLIYIEFIERGTFEEFDVDKVLCNNDRICTRVNLKKDKITLVYPTRINGVVGTTELDLILN